MGKIIQVIEQAGFKISNLRMIKMSPQEVVDMKQNMVNNELVQYMSSDMVIGIDLVRENAISVL